MTLYVTKNIGINIPWDKARVQRVLLLLIAALSALAIVLGFACILISSYASYIEIEAGDALSASDITGDPDAVFGGGFDPEYLLKPGRYAFTVISRGEERNVRLTVKDTKAPLVTVRDVYFSVGQALPEPEDFILSVIEPDGYTGEFVSSVPEIKNVGSYPVSVRFTDHSGNKTEVFDVEMHLIYDNTPPTVKLLQKEISVYIGETPPYADLVRLKDDCIGEITVSADESLLDLSEEGKYKVGIVATDASGNVSEPVYLTVRVLERTESTDDETEQPER